MNANTKLELPGDWEDGMQLLYDMLVGQCGPIVGACLNEEDVRKLTTAACVISRLMQSEQSTAKFMWQYSNKINAKTDD